MRVFHLYPKTSNMGDHLVRRGIVSLMQGLVASVEFSNFDASRRDPAKRQRGRPDEDYTDFGLSERLARRANEEADLILVGGSNLYEGTTSWGLYVEEGALEMLRIPLFLVGIGTGSEFLGRRPTRPAPTVREQILQVNELAQFSGVRDIVTNRWLRELGARNAVLMGDPATFIFNEPWRPRGSGPVLVAVPPIRFLGRPARTRLWDPRGRRLFDAFSETARLLRGAGEHVVAVCNDYRDIEVARELFPLGTVEVETPSNDQEYLSLLSGARAVVTGRLHTAVVSFSLAIPFLLWDVDQRTRGFIETYGLDAWTLRPRFASGSRKLREAVPRLLQQENGQGWPELIARRDAMSEVARTALRSALLESGLIDGRGDRGRT
jgi:polysaccharide pyruvyl transferase WcaK-like protein